MYVTRSFCLSTVQFYDSLAKIKKSTLFITYQKSEFLDDETNSTKLVKITYVLCRIKQKEKILDPFAYHCSSVLAITTQTMNSFT